MSLKFKYINIHHNCEYKSLQYIININDIKKFFNIELYNLK